MISIHRILILNYQVYTKTCDAEAVDLFLLSINYD